jgi:hypothetical protein
MANDKESGSVTVHSRFTFELQRLRRIPSWLWAARHLSSLWSALFRGTLGLAVVLLVVDWAGYALGWSRPVRLNFAGWILETLGLVIVVIGAWLLEQEMHPNPDPTTLRGWLRTNPMIRRDVTVALSGLSLTMSTGRAYAKVTRKPGTTVDERLAVLEQTLRDLEGQVENIQRTTDAEIDSLKTQLKGEAAARVAATDSLTRRMDETLDKLLVGGISLEMIGVLWIFVGMTITNIPDLVYYWFRWYYDLVQIPWFVGN